MTPQTKTPPDSDGSALAAQQEPEDDKVLDLTDLTEPRRLVKLKTKRLPAGEAFELRTLDDFGIEQQQRLLMLQRRYQELMQRNDDLDSSDREKLRHTFDQLFDTVLDAPKATKNQMTDAVKARVVNAFIVGPLLARQEAQMEIINRLVAKEYVAQAKVDEVMMEIRRELAEQMTQAMSTTAS